MAIISAHKNDIGRNKKRDNEDYIWVDDQVGLYIVADGMGGHEAGDVASELAATTIADLIVKQLAQQRNSNTLDTDAIKTIIVDAAEAANKKVYQAAHAAKQKRQMGTTVVLAFIASSTAYISHAGDSRAYLVRNATLTQLTEDDSWGTFSSQSSGTDGAPSPLDPVLTKAVGQNTSLDPSFTTVDLMPDDILLLCSDGLWNMLDTDRILAEVEKSGSTLDKAVEALVAAANDAGGRDNISVVMVKHTAS
ncbi:MAG: serine/threonine-protein phosphatase [Anaerolineae bacterium]|nr:serine/threonine-protein phosphatase [Anaerolineae bacterium]